MIFRDLTADEIECRIGMIKTNGLSLLLYKDARCDMNILDETVGPLNWKREHSRENANCIVSIWDKDKGQWISKEDTGTESNTEKEKGLASDSFKRACVNWGIGRELYTSPFVWIPTNLCNIKEGKCYDRFEVTHIAIENKQITELKIVNATTGVECFKWKAEAAKIEPIEDEKLTEAEANELYGYMQRKGLDDAKITETLQKNYGVNTLNELTRSQYAMIKINLMKNKGEK
jgi:hypothetical protein